MVPAGVQKLKIHTNVIIMQNENGEGNFQLSNPDHVSFLNDVFEGVNERLENLVQESCNCSTNPAHYDNAHIEFVPNFIEVEDEFFWDHNNDASAPSPLWNSVYLEGIDALVSQMPGYSDGFNFVITTDGTAFYDYNGTVPLWNMNYSHNYGGVWYSGFPTSDIDSKARWHAPDMYMWYINGLDAFGPGWRPDYLNFCIGGALHEYGHFLNLTHVGCSLNVMKPNNMVVRTSFSGCQIREVYKTLMARNIRKYVSCEAGLDHLIEINSDETWAMDIRVYNDIRVKAGATLTITCNVEMEPETHIFVEEGAKLVVDGATITSCGLWKGIKVVGGDNSDYDIEIKNSAFIENVSGAAVSNFAPSGGWLLGGNGNAKIFIEKSTFNNCTRMCEMGAFPQLFNSSQILDNTQNGGKWGVTNWNCLGVTVDGNTFNGQSRDCIHTVDGSFSSISGNTFNSENIDVLLINSYPGEGSLIETNTFNGQNIGLHCVGATNGQQVISDNSFRNTLYGMFMDNHNSYYTYNNDFDSDFGIISAGNGFPNNEVFDNSFNGNAIGIYPFGGNGGYNFTTNCFNTSLADAYIDDDIFVAIKTDQGAAGNCFTHGGVLGSAIDIEGDMDFFTYYENDNQNDDCYNVLNTGNFGLEPDDEVKANNCGSSIGPGGVRFNPCAIYETEQFRQHAIDILNKRINAIQNSNLLTQAQKDRLIAFYERCLSRHSNKKFSELIKDGLFAQARALYNGTTDVEEKLLIYGSYFREGNYLTAKTYLESLGGEPNIELIDFKIVQRINLNRMQSDYNTSEDDVLTLRAIAEKHHVYSAYAKALYYFFTGELIITPVPEVNMLTPRSIKKDVTANDGILIFPNPAGQNVFVTTSEELVYLDVIIYNLQGKIVLENEIKNNSESIDVSTLSEGVYVIAISTGDRIVKQEKLVIIK